jgi:hypothetical protein
MLWFFEKQDACLHYEIRRQSDGDEYELVITYPDGRQEIEVYEDPTAVTERSRRLQDALVAAGWHTPQALRRPPRKKALVPVNPGRGRTPGLPWYD